jgi:hypothetical protein
MQDSDELKKLADKALDYMASEAGKKSLREAAEKSREATETFKRARDIEPEQLNQRFTV